MKLPFRTTLSRQEPVKRSRLKRVLRGTLYVKLGLLVFLAVALGLFYLRLSAAPMSFGRLPERVAEALAERIGPGWNVTLRNTAIELHDGSPALRANGLDIRAPGGDLVLRAPYAILSVDLMSLLTANLQPKAIEVRDLQLRVLVNRDGSLTFSPVQAETETGNAAPPPVAPAPSKEAAASLARDANGPSPVSGAIGSLLELIVGPSSVLNTLGQAQLTNARLVFIDADGRERARFQRVDAAFDWAENGGREFAATVEGDQGPWQLNGDVTAQGKASYRASVTAEAAPIKDILLLTGSSDLPATTDVEFSGRFDIAFADGRLTELKTRLESNAGTVQIDDKDTSPFPVEHADDRSPLGRGREGASTRIPGGEGGRDAVPPAGPTVDTQRKQPLAHVPQRPRRRVVRGCRRRQACPGERVRRRPVGARRGHDQQLDAQRAGPVRPHQWPPAAPARIRRR